MGRKGTTKSGGRKHALDKFYTKPSVARECVARLNISDYDLIIEPSAGSGSFSNEIPGCLAFDLQPESPGIIEQDWFDYSRKRDPSTRVLVIGNPPFGQQNGLAIRFINHAAQFADTIAFIVPKSFRKESVITRIDPHLHLIDDWDLPAKSFTLDGAPIDVPCIWQVWEYRPTRRPPLKKPQPIGFRFVKKHENPDFYIQRVGGNAGKAGKDWQKRSEQSTHFAKVSSADADALIKIINNANWDVRDHSVGPRSLSQTEILRYLAAHAPTYATER